MMIDYLMDMGFAWEEAVTLHNMREHLYENAEMQQRMTEDHRMQFVQWLYAQGESTIINKRSPRALYSCGPSESYRKLQIMRKA